VGAANQIDSAQSTVDNDLAKQARRLYLVAD
jgi:hypothetical protein